MRIGLARRVFEMALRGQSILEIMKTLNAEGIPTSRGKRWLKSRAPKQVNPRRVSSPYLLSGLVSCELCSVSMTAVEAKGGQHT